MPVGSSELQQYSLLSPPPPIPPLPRALEHQLLDVVMKILDGQGISWPKPPGLKRLASQEKTRVMVLRLLEVKLGLRKPNSFSTATQPQIQPVVSHYCGHYLYTICILFVNYYTLHCIYILFAYYSHTICKLLHTICIPFTYYLQTTTHYLHIICTLSVYYLQTTTRYLYTIRILFANYYTLSAYYFRTLYILFANCYTHSSIFCVIMHFWLSSLSPLLTTPTGRGQVSLQRPGGSAEVPPPVRRGGATEGARSLHLLRLPHPESGLQRLPPPQETAAHGQDHQAGATPPDHPPFPGLGGSGDWRVLSKPGGNHRRFFKRIHPPETTVSQGCEGGYSSFFFFFFFLRDKRPKMFRLHTLQVMRTCTLEVR